MNPQSIEIPGSDDDLSHYYWIITTPDGRHIYIPVHKDWENVSDPLVADAENLGLGQYVVKNVTSDFMQKLNTAITNSTARVLD